FQDFWHQLCAALSDAARPGHLLSDAVLAQSNGLVHSPLNARIAPAHLCEPDDPDGPACRDAVGRVIAAYRRAQADRRGAPAPCMWERITSEKGRFLKALERGDVPALCRDLGRMFRTDLVWGLGHVHESHPDLLAGSPEGSFVHLKFTDTLVNLAEAVGAARVTSMEQDGVGHLQPLNVDLDELARAVLGRAGMDLSFPAVGAAYGFRVADRFLTIDSLVHGYTLHRLRQLGAGPGSEVAEIGGGYGCLAMLAHRAGLRRYTIYDLPWVNALQGYFLITSLPPGSVRLYGESAETTGALSVMPYWAIEDVPDGSVDYFVNTDSIPEMGLETGRGYVRHIRRLLRGAFLSINQEAKAPSGGYGNQLCVRELVEEAGGFRAESRCRAWMRCGYVEEVFRPAGRPAPGADCAGGGM
ncbi:MAG TPA: putative sugar O-methyltransferase, partial [Gemmataceae bacterium]